jgi:uncharacterized protein (TIGR02145 family)
MKEVKIGDQIWMSKNLDVDTFRNGDPIPHAETDEAWEEAAENQEPAWCYYDNDPTNGEKYGKLYNWYAVNDPRGLAPEGWYIPSDDEWMTLIDYLGGEIEAGVKMKSTIGWNDDGNGTNESGFSGLPAGDRNWSFYDIGKCGYWWSSTEEATHSALGYLPPTVFLHKHGRLINFPTHQKDNSINYKNLITNVAS